MAALGEPIEELGLTAGLVVIAIGALTAIVPALLVPRITVDA